MVYGLGERLHQQRLNMRLSQKEVAASIGVSPSIVSNYENGERTPSLEILMSLANLYRCSTDYLLGMEKSPVSILDTSMLDNRQLQLLQAFLSGLNGQG